MARRNWNDEELEFLRKNYGVLSLEEIGQTLNRSIPSIKHKAERNNIRSVCRAEQKWTDQQIQYLIENYKDKTNKELAEILHKTKVAVDMKANNLGLKNTKYSYDQNFFSVIDTEEKAYWCGFIMADGCVTIQEDINSCELTIQLQKSDVGHLKKFNKSIGGNAEITFFTQICSFTGKPTEACRIRFYSQQLVHGLGQYGVIPCKSLIKQFPSNIPDSLMNHFIRGYFDGNGTIYTYQNNPRCSFATGSKDFVIGLQTYLWTHGFRCGKICKTHDAHVYTFAILEKDKGIYSFLKFIYNNSSIYLDRKYQKAQNFI